MTTERQPTREPRTEAGRELLSFVGVTPDGLRIVAASHVERLVPHIEAEAYERGAAAARAEVAALDVERLARALAEEGRYIGWTDADWRKQASKVAAAYENDR